MKVLLISPFCNNYRFPLYLPSENLGLAYIASYLRESDIEVDIFDANMLEIAAKEILLHVEISEYILVGIASSAHILINETSKIASEIKKKYPNVHITIGGHFPSFRYEAILQSIPHIDSIVHGDGEEIVLNLVKSLSREKKLYDINGLIFRGSSGQVIKNKIHNSSMNLDTLPHPSRDSLSYIQKNGHTWPTQISTSRGCYGNCTFCDINAFYGRKWRSRNAESVVDEIESLTIKFNSRRFRLTDDEFIGPSPHGPQRAASIASEIIKRGLNVELMIDARAHAVDFALFKLLKEAGVMDCLIGIESGVDRILSLYNKGMRVSQNLKAIEILRKLEINLNLAFIMIDPRMSLDELGESYNFLKENDIITTDSLKSWLWPLHGTKVYNQLKSQKIIIEESLSEVRYKFSDARVEKIFHIIKKCKKITYPLERAIYSVNKKGQWPQSDLNRIVCQNEILWIDIFEAALEDPYLNDFDWIKKKMYEIFINIENVSNHNTL